MARVLAETSPDTRNRMMIAGAVVFAAIAAILLFVALQSRDSGGGSNSAVATTDVVVATRAIDANTKLTSDLLELKAVSTDQVLAGAYTNLDNVIGLPVRYPVQAGEQITSTKVGVEAIADEKDLALVLPDGQRAFSVTASEVTAVGGLLLPGNNVDVIAVFSDPNSNTPQRAVTVLQNISILAVAQEAQQPVPAASDSQATPVNGQPAQGLQGQRPSDVKRQPDARSVTLAVTPDQAQLLAALQSQDSVDIWLSLRPADDKSNVPIGETNLSQFYSLPPQ